MPLLRRFRQAAFVNVGLALRGDAFLQRGDAGGFALWWDAHGLLYGIPRDIEPDLAAGRCVVANLSRGALADAASRYPLLVLEITAPPELLAARLAARGLLDLLSGKAPFNEVKF